ncbi:MAG: DnaB-like helicase C-terminal domain-containing protein, partial [Leuconostoc mesenteroides]
LGLKDINELFVHHGIDATRKAVMSAIPVPEVGLSRLADYKEVEFQEGCILGFEEIDKATGGNPNGLFTVISGDNNAGKTTLLLNLAATFISEGEKCFYWSGEQKPDRVRWWYEQIVAGRKNISSRISSRTGREYWFANPSIVPTIREWYRDKLFVYDKRGIDSAQFFEVAELAVRRHQVTKIFIDNLMAFTGGEEEYYAAQGDFAESCKNFAEDWDVHVILIAHNKKPYKVKDEQSARLPDKDDIEGSKKITNWADFVFQLIRITEANRKESWGAAKSILSLCKNRETETLVDVRLDFDPSSKRLVQLTHSENIDKLLGWEKEKKQEMELNF